MSATVCAARIVSVSARSYESAEVEPRFAEELSQGQILSALITAAAGNSYSCKG